MKLKKSYFSHFLNSSFWQVILLVLNYKLKSFCNEEKPAEEHCNFSRDEKRNGDRAFTDLPAETGNCTKRIA
jgi:hypothetical protein